MEHNMIANLCRLCATKDVDSSTAENSSSNDCLNRRTLLSLIGKYLNIGISGNDSLPQKFCSGCAQNLYSFDHFSQRCHEVQQMFIVLSNGSPFMNEHKSLLQECDSLLKLESTSNKFQNLKWQVRNEENGASSEANINDDLSNMHVNDANEEEIPLAQRSKNNFKASSDLKRKRGRPKKPIPRVPPLRIKAVKSKKMNEETETRLNESSSMQYEIHSNEKCIKEGDNKSEHLLHCEDDINDNLDDADNYSEDSITLKDIKDTQKTPRKNPFALFEFKCITCQEIFKNFSVLKRHCKKEHGTSASVNCVCGKQLRARTAIIEHRRKHTGTSLYKCDSCSKTFNRRSLMCLHMVSHMPKDEQPYVCCKCAKRFHTSSLLKKHEKVHLPEEERFLDVCNICQKKFTSKSAVNAHLRAVHYGEKPFVCEHCGNSFSSKAILTDHLTTHSTYAPWPCNVCGRNFKSKYRLNVHMDMHRSVKYRCPHCPMELSTRRTLRMHLLVHKEEKAYVCKVCSKAFRRSKDLKNHSNLHTGRRPYKCEFCERTFANGSNCRAHKLRMHPEELGVEKNGRNSSKQAAKTIANSLNTLTAITIAPPPPQALVMPCPMDETSKLKTLTTLTDVVKCQPVIDYMKYENKYEFPATSQELDYSLEYARYTTPLNLNMKKPTFMQQPPMNHLPTFTTDMHTDMSKMHFLYS